MMPQENMPCLFLWLWRHYTHPLMHTPAPTPGHPRRHLEVHRARGRKHKLCPGGAGAEGAGSAKAMEDSSSTLCVLGGKETEPALSDFVLRARGKLKRP